MPQIVDDGRGIGPQAGRVAQRLPKIRPLWPLRGKGEQILLGPAEKGRFERLGQRKIIFGKREKFQKREDVSDSKLFADLEAVGPRDLEALSLAGADQRTKKRRTPLHEDQDIPLGDPALGECSG